MTTNGKCFLCGTPLATPEQIDRHICDVCGAMVKDNAALNMILLRALYMAAGADILKAAICNPCAVCAHKPRMGADDMEVLMCIAADGECAKCKSASCMCKECRDYFYFSWRGLGIRSME